MNLLTNEQIAYLKSLESKKKRREFLLDCLIGNITAQEVDFEIPINYGKFENDGTGFNTTTAPRTFEGIDEEYKWDKNPKLEDIIKSKLLIRGFKNEDLLNNRGLIGATIDETVIEVVKNYQFANENTEEKFTKEDMRKCFNEARYLKMEWKSGSVITVSKFTNFDDYLKSIEK